MKILSGGVTPFAFDDPRFSFAFRITFPFVGCSKKGKCKFQTSESIGDSPWVLTRII